MSKKLLRLIELVFAAVLGAIIAFYRVSLARSGNELMFGGVSHPSGFLYGFIVLCMAGFAAAAIVLKQRQTLSKGTAGRLHTALLSLSALVLFGAFALMLSDGVDGLFKKVQLIFLAVCGTVMIVKIVLGERHKLIGLLSLFPIYYLCLFLLMFYRENAKNPSVQSFSLEIVTVMVVLLALYVLASTKFEKPKLRQQIFFTLAAVFLLVMECVSALMYPGLVFTVPGMSAGVLCMLGGFGLYIAASFFLAPVRLVFDEEQSTSTNKPERPVPPDSETPAEEEADELVNIDREELLRTILREETLKPQQDQPPLE